MRSRCRYCDDEVTPFLNAQSAVNWYAIERTTGIQRCYGVSMTRLFFSTVIGVVLGAVIGLFIGWEVAPVEYVNSPMHDLAQRYKDEYTVMVASGFLFDGSATAAIERLRVLDVENVPAYVQEVTERYITNSRDLRDIRLLVALSEGLGRLTPIMEPYRDLQLGGVS